MPPTIKQHITLIPGGVKYLGNDLLVQFEVTNITMISKRSDYIVVEITLRRMISYHIVSTFSPTLLLLLIGIITLFLDESHFEATIMLAITAMLVMYTLYESASSGLPKTAYLKMIDIWLIFGLVVPFIVFLVEMAVEIMRNDDSDEQEGGEESSEIEIMDHSSDSEAISEKSSKKHDISWVGSEKQKDVKDMRSKFFQILFEKSKIGKSAEKNEGKSKLKMLAQILIPVLCFFFILGYMILACTYYKS